MNTDNQLDIFGQPHPRRVRAGRKAWQPGLFSWEQERAADVQDAEAILEAFRRAVGNRSEDDSE